MTTTTSLLPPSSHKPPPLKPTVFLRTNYYGSMGRPSGKRKSAVELLAESKSHYVKSEKVLDGKQELKNQDHLHVRSPTIDVSTGTIISGTPITTSTSTMLRSPAPPIINGGGPFPFAMCLTCPPYPHQHFEHFDHYQNNQHHHHHNHHLSQGSLHLNQQQHHLNAPLGGSSVVSGGGGGGNSSGPPSVESGGTASTGSTGGGGGVSAITTLGRSGSGKHHNRQHHHYHHSSSQPNHHSKQQRSSSTGSSGGGSRGHQSILQENIIIEPLTLLSTSSTSLKTNTIGRHSSSKNRQIQPPGTLSIISKREFQNQLKRDSGNVLASLLPGMSFTLPAQSSHSHQHHHHLHHYHHHHHSSSKNNASHHTHPQLLLQQKALASVASSTSTPSYSSTTSVATGATAANAANGLSGGGVRTTTATTNSTTSASARHRDVKTSNHGIGLHAHHHHRDRRNFNDDDDDSFDNDEDSTDSPPLLPPKSPRIITNTPIKPARPHDFPQQLQLSVVDPSIESSAKKQSLPQDVPPPPPRRHSSSNSSSSHHPPPLPPVPPHFHEWIVENAGLQLNYNSDVYHRPYLYGKVVSRKEEAEHQVHITTSTSGVYCGGTLIAKDVVVTAGHCVWDMKARKIYEGLRITYGMIDLIHGSGQSFQVKGNPKILPKFGSYVFPVDVRSQGNRVHMADPYYKNDLAVVKLDGMVAIAPENIPGLPKQGDLFMEGTEYAFPTGSQSTIYGGTMTTRNFTLLDGDDCQRRLDRLRSANLILKVGKILICGVEKYSGGSTCDRELGGGLICKDKRGKEIICGVQVFRLCESSIPNAFINMAEVSYFIKEAISSF